MGGGWCHGLLCCLVKNGHGVGGGPGEGMLWGRGGEGG